DETDRVDDGLVPRPAHRPDSELEPEVEETEFSSARFTANETSSTGGVAASSNPMVPVARDDASEVGPSTVRSTEGTDVELTVTTMFVADSPGIMLASTSSTIIEKRVADSLDDAEERSTGSIAI